MAIERDTDDAVPAPAPWRWQHFCRGIEVYTRDPEPPAGEPFTGCYRGSVRTGGEWRVYPDEVSPDTVATGTAEGGSEAERMAAARGEVEQRVGGEEGRGSDDCGNEEKATETELSDRREVLLTSSKCHVAEATGGKVWSASYPSSAAQGLAVQCVIASVPGYDPFASDGDSGEEKKR